MYTENIKKIAKVLIDEIEKYYPGITKKTFDSVGLPITDEFITDNVGTPAQIRAELCIYIELLKAGVRFDELDKC